MHSIPLRLINSRNPIKDKNNKGNKRDKCKGKVKLPKSSKGLITTDDFITKMDKLINNVTSVIKEKEKNAKFCEAYTTVV